MPPIHTLWTRLTQPRPDPQPVPSPTTGATPPAPQDGWDGSTLRLPFSGETAAQFRARLGDDPLRQAAIDRVRQSWGTPAVGALTGAGLDAMSAVLDPGLPLVRGKPILLHADGFFLRGPYNREPRFDAQGAQVLYRAARGLADAPPDILGHIPVGVRQRLLAHLEQALAAGNTDGGLPDISRRKLRAGAVTALLTLAQSSPDAPALAARAVDLLLTQGLTDPEPRLQAFIHLNLEALCKAVPFGADQELRFAALSEQVRPTRPPYEALFASPDKVFQVAHYAHEEAWRWDNPVRAYERAGYRVVDHQPATDGREEIWVLEARLTDPARQQPDTPVRVRLVKSNREILRDLDRPEIDAIVYTGHAHLGGNVSEAVRLGPEQLGKKLLVFTVCRGAQTLHQVANRCPHSAVITTRDPSYFTNMMGVVLGTLQGVAARQTYAEMREAWQFDYRGEPKDNFILPGEERYARYTDFNRDGVADLTPFGVQRFFNVIDDHADGGKTDLRPRAVEAHADEIDAAKVIDAVHFARTIIDAHHEYNRTYGESPLARVSPASLIAGGWYDGALADPPVAVVEQRDAGGAAHLVVRVNKHYKDQSPFALGALVQLELVRHFAGDSAGTPANRGLSLLLAGEFLQQMYAPREEAQAVIAALGERLEVRGATWDALAAVFATDHHGFGSLDHVRQLSRALNLA